MLGSTARERGHGDLDRDDDRYGDPDHLAHYAGEMRRRDPDLLGGLLGGAWGWPAAVPVVAAIRWPGPWPGGADRVTGRQADLDP
ncbi:MAG: hypothetical protein M3P46_09445 [Actinomycetota bacterium]|nr:hypothetical protein [Actinomycetota bacterium]